MKPSLFALTFALLAGIAPVAMAQSAEKTGYINIINRLKVDGISPSSIRWSEIDALCLPLKSSSPADYNECRYERAILQSDYEDDATLCRDTAQAFRPTRLRYRAVALGESMDGATEEALTLLNTTPAIANERAFTRHVFQQCMSNKGWRSPRDYRRGRND